MAWDGLEYLKLRRWRTAFETADGVDFTTGREILGSEVTNCGTKRPEARSK